jgi:hypothetical protein
MPKDRSTARRQDGRPEDAQPATRLVLAMPAGHHPDWEAASSLVESMTSDELDEFGADAAAVLGKRDTLDAETVRVSLRNALAELASAMCDPAPVNDRKRQVMDRAEVLVEPHPPGRPTFLYGFIRLLDLVGVLDVLGCQSLCDPVW